MTGRGVRGRTGYSMGTFRIGGGRGVALVSAVISLTLAHSTPLHSTPAQTLKARICLPPATSPFHSRNSALARSTSSPLWMCSYFRRLEFSNFPLALPRNSGLGGWVRYHPRPRPAAPSRPRIENERDFAKGRGRPPLLISRSCNFKPPSLSPLAWCQLQ